MREKCIKINSLFWIPLEEIVKKIREFGGRSSWDFRMKDEMLFIKVFQLLWRLRGERGFACETLVDYRTQRP